MVALDENVSAISPNVLHVLMPRVALLTQVHSLSITTFINYEKTNVLKIVNMLHVSYC